MKIIEQHQNGIRYRCNHCETVLEYTIDDVKEYKPQIICGVPIPEFRYITCPVCKSTLNLGSKK